MIASNDALHFFWCRWPTQRPVRVALPPSADAAERALLGRALAAWERAIPELRFALDPGAPELRIHLDDASEAGARTAADCAVGTPLPAAGRLSAQLVRAEVWLHRSEGDAWGRPAPLTEAELLGSAAHEIGHALGLQGHARRADTALSRDVDRVRRVGARLARGEPLAEPAAAALYALPSGTRVERRALPPGSLPALAALARRAERAGAAHLEVRLGDESARIRWGGTPELGYYLRDPAGLFRGVTALAGSLAFPAPSE